MKTPPQSPREVQTWTSPIKQQSDNELVNKTKRVRATRSLFKEEGDEVQTQSHSFLNLFEVKKEEPLLNLSNSKPNMNSSPTYESLSIDYNIDFLKPPTSTKGENFFDVRELVKNIETYLYKHPPQKIDLKALKIRIYKILHDKKLDHTTKMGELGLILFYLDHPTKLFPEDQPSLIAFRAKQIEKEVYELVLRHEKTCTNKLIPSGKTHYLQRAFAHMAMTSTQIYNKGGLYALLKILEEPAYCVSTYLRAEHYEHILIVTRQILANGAFEGLFQGKIEIYSELQDAIRIDLKLDPKAKVRTTHLFWDCLMFLFSDIRQINRPNCYAIGALIYASENAPYKVIETLINWLKRGHLSFNENLNIPIFPLLEKRLIYTLDLQVELPSQKAFSLTTFKHISRTLKVDLCESSSSDDLLPLQRTLKTILQGEEASSQLPYAEKLYYAYKYNTLAHLMLSVIEFDHMNSPREPESSFSPQKENFIRCIMRSLSNKAKEKIPKGDHIKILNIIFNKLGQKLWFESCSEIDVRYSEKAVYVGEKKIENFEGDPKKLVSLYKASLRVFYLENGKYGLIDSISDLQNALCSTVDEVAQNVNSKNLFNLLKSYISSFEFKKKIARHSVSQIQQKGISTFALQKADLLLFEQKGGQSESVLERIFDMMVITTYVSGATTPYQFIEKLLKVLKKLDKTLLKSAPRILAGTFGTHLWTLSPKRLRLLIESSDDSFFNFIQNSVFNFANTYIRGNISKETIQAIIKRYAGDNEETYRSMEEKLLSIRYLSFERFRSIMLDKVSGKRYNEAKEIIDDEFNKINTLELDLKRICKELEIELPLTVEGEIRKELGGVRRHPYQIAYQLRKLFIQKGICVIDPYDMEIAISYAHHLPITFDIGDLNWDEGEYREDPPHPHLVIRYNWADRTLGYYRRMSDRESLTEKNEFERFEIQHPLVKPAPQNIWN